MSRIRIWAALVVLATASPAAAQGREIDVGAAIGSGITIGQSSAGAVTRRSRTFLDFGARTWNDERPDFSWGGSLRLEVEGHASVALVPRAELPRTIGPVLVRASVGAPMFFAPFTMFGIEVGGTATWSFASRFGVFAALLFDAFVFGSDLPEGSALLMCNLALGVELEPT